MKIYVVMQKVPWEGDTLHGLFATEGLAQSYIDEYDFEDNWVDDDKEDFVVEEHKMIGI